MFSSKAAAKAFSLVELMVVIMIILALTSVMLVGFSRAQGRSQQIQCMNNLRQLGVAVLTYATQNGSGYLPNLSLTGARGQRELWVFQLDFLDEDTDRYLGAEQSVKVVPPRAAPAVLRCPADVNTFVNSQSILTSYWMHPENSQKSLASIRDQDKTILSFEGDPIHIQRPCGCRWERMFPPEELDTTHFGGAHILFVDGSVKLFTNPIDRLRVTWEQRVGWNTEYLMEKHAWSLDARITHD